MFQMTSLVACQVCKECFQGSVGELHVHYISNHSPEELSLALLVAQQLLPQSPHSSMGAEDLVLNKALARHPSFLPTPVAKDPSEKPVEKVVKSATRKKRTRKVTPSTKVVSFASAGATKSAKKQRIEEVEFVEINGNADISDTQKIDDQQNSENITEVNVLSSTNDPNKNVLQMYETESTTSVRSCQVSSIAIKNSTVTRRVPNTSKTAKSKASDNTVATLTSETDILTALGLAKRSPKLYKALLRKKTPTEEADNQDNSKRAVPALLPAETFPKPSHKFTQSILKTSQPEVNEVLNEPVEVEEWIIGMPEVNDPLSTGNGQEESSDSIMSQPPAPNAPYELKMLPPGNERRYLCNLCPNTYKKKSHLDRHIKSHTGERPFECTLCQKRFAVRSVLKQHMRTHTGEKPYACSVCGLTFKQTSGLMTHMMLHTGKPYKCDLCEKSYVSNHKLVQHSRTHAGTKAYTCNTCKASFFTSSALKQHERILHSGKKNHTCEVCGHSFKLEVSLKVHLDNHIRELGGEEIIEQLTKSNLENADEISNASTEITSV
jgi:uncharacterized Zn-finger protein